MQIILHQEIMELMDVLVHMVVMNGTGEVVAAAVQVQIRKIFVQILLEM